MPIDETMRKRGDWMRPTDDQLLETLHDAGLVLPPSVLAYNLGFSRTHVANRFAEFEEKGLINKVERGKYEISERGRAYLKGDYDASELDEE